MNFETLKYIDDAYETGLDVGYKRGYIAGLDEANKEIEVLKQTIERLKDVIASSYHYDLDDEEED